jgi:hypothetical protein
MNSETEKNANRSESIEASLTKRPWHVPEIEEVDFAETEAGGAFVTGADGGFYS